MMRRAGEEFDERFTAFVRSRGEHHLRMATLLTGSPDTAEDLVQASLLKLYRAWDRIDTSRAPDAYLRRIIVNTHRSWWRALRRQ
jgi:DNA-directed RNA polymerase specialized sigma24 family protein